MRAVLVGEQSPLVLEEQRRIAEAKAQEVEAARVIMEAERSTAEQRAQEAEAALQLARVQAQAPALGTLGTPLGRTIGPGRR